MNDAQIEKSKLNSKECADEEMRKLFIKWSKYINKSIQGY